MQIVEILILAFVLSELIVLLYHILKMRMYERTIEDHMTKMDSHIDALDKHATKLDQLLKESQK